MSDYVAFLAGKRREWTGCGLDVPEADLPAGLYPFQRALTRWALRKGRAALWADTGLGKTPMQLAWAEAICKRTGGRALILAPLAVNAQTVREAEKFGIAARAVRSQDEVGEGISVANYEMLAHFDPAAFTAIVLDESSILKSYMGATKRRLVEAFADTPYRLCCTATPAPNDHLELGNHCEFLGIMRSNEMISRWFINDPMEAGAYRLKAHGAADFWRWVASWAAALSNPADLGFDGSAFALPPLAVENVSVGYVHVAPTDGHLFVQPDLSATLLHATLRASAPLRAQKVAELVRAEPDEAWLIWTHTDYDAAAIRAVMPDVVEVRGGDTVAVKERALLGFSDGAVRVLMTKPSIAGFGMNWQHCARVIFAGLSYSYEQFYQAIRRSWRYGQTRAVRVYALAADNEYAVLDTIQRKAAAHETLKREMLSYCHDETVRQLSGTRPRVAAIDREESAGEMWRMIRADAVPEVEALAPESVDFTVFSPPFSNLYIYSDALADMGNSADHTEFFAHFRYLALGLYRATVPGRLCAMHVKDLPRYMGRDGAAGLYDFPGECIRLFESCGWQYHSRVTIWKDPVIEMQRTKNHGLLYKQLRADSSASRQGMADYVLTFRKWDGRLRDFPKPVTHAREDFPLDRWQRWASPVWDDIQQTRVLQYRDAKSSEDERHICPLQLDVIERCVALWSNPGDLVLSPFAGIGSEGYQSILRGRRFVGIELKREYYQAAVRNLQRAEMQAHAQQRLDFSVATP